MGVEMESNVSVDVNRDFYIDKAIENYKKYQEDNEKEALNYHVMKELADVVPHLLDTIADLQNENQQIKQNKKWLADELEKCLFCLSEYKE
jgi:transketolase